MNKEDKKALNEKLIDAALDGNLEDVKKYIAEGADKECRSKIYDGWTALHATVYRGHMHVVQWLIEEAGMDPLDKLSAKGQTALHLAAEGGKLDVTKWLIEEKGMDPMVKTSQEGETALHLATKSGNIELIKWLIEQKGTDPMVKSSKKGETSLHVAAYCGRLNLIKWLIEEKGMDPMDKSSERDFNKKYLVVDVKEAAAARTVTITVAFSESDQLLRRTEASLDSWKTVDKDFQSLAGLTSRSKFISTLQTVLEELNIDFYDVNDTCNDGASGSSSETPLQQPAKKPKYKHNNSFLEEVQIMRELHPKKEDYVFNQFWDSSHKEWRQLCASSLGFERGMEGTFGGTFRERLYVATLPQSCFEIVSELEDSMTQGMVRSSFKTTQLTGGLFQSFVGFKEERPVRFALQQLVNGTTTMKEFREKGKSLKITNRLQNDTEESRQTRIIQQQGEEIISLKAENGILKAENDRLKTLLREVEQTNASNEEESIQDDDTDSNPDEDELAVGTKISARWSDGSFYNAVIISKRKNGYYVKYFDGWKKVVSRRDIKIL